MKNEIDIDNALLELEENDELYSTVFDEEVKNVIILFMKFGL